MTTRYYFPDLVSLVYYVEFSNVTVMHFAKWETYMYMLDVDDKYSNPICAR